MTEHSAIEWTDATFNPWRGCARVSPGCVNCYAETLSKRNPKVLGTWGVDGTRVVASETYWREPLKWNAAATAAGTRPRVFCASLADVFEDREDLLAPRGRLWRLILDTPALDWLLLTKRPENITRMTPGWFRHWPAHVWIGTTVEDRARKARIDTLRVNRDAPVRFLSLEPLLEDLGELDLRGIDWVIVGGESGGKARPLDVGWVRDIVSQCRGAGVPVFVKQLGKWPSVEGKPTGVRWMQLYDDKPYRPSEYWAPFSGGSGKHGDPNDWPEDIRVRAFPTPAVQPCR